MKIRRTGWLSILIVASLLVGLSACGKKPKDKALRNSVTIAVLADATTLDAQMFSDNLTEGICANIYDPIVRIDADGQISGCIAESWDISPDGLEYLFHIKKGVKFHNGDLLKASDVAFTLNRCRDSSFVGTYFNYIDKVETVDEKEVKVTLHYPYSSFLPILACYSGVVSEKLLTENPDAMARQPVGTGPYSFVSWEPGNKIILKAFPDYHLGKAAIQDLIFKVIADSSTATIALQKAEIDAYVNVASVDRKTILDDKNLKLEERSSAAFRFLGINCGKEPFNNLKVRQAIAHAIDKSAIVLGAEDGNGVVASSHIPASVIGYEADFKELELNREKSKQLLAEAGYPDGFICSLTTTENRSMHAQIIQADLKKIGIEVKIKLLESGTYYEELENGDCELYILGWSYIAQDPDVAIYDLYHSDCALTGNYGRYQNPAMDKMLAEARTSVDNDRRQQLYREIEELCRDEAFNIPLYWTVANIGFNKDLQGVKASPKSSYFVYPFSWAENTK